MTAIAALMHSIACQKSTGNQLTLQVYRKDNCVRNTYKKLSYRWQTGFLSEYVDKKLTRDYNVILYLSIFNSFWVIRCSSQCVSPKIAIFTTFFVSLGRPAKCCMDGKRIQAYKLSRCAHLTITVSEIQRDSCEKNRHFIIPPCIRRPRSGGSRRNIATPFGMEKLELCGYQMVENFRRYLYSFWRNSRTWQTDRQTDGRTSRDGIYRAYA